MVKSIKTKREHPPYFVFKTWIVQNDIKLKDIAVALGTTEADIINKNDGLSDYSINEFNALADVFGVDLNLFKPCSTKCSTKILKPQKQVSVHYNK